MSFKTVHEEIAAERRRQIEVEGFTAEHDADHAGGELFAAGKAYLMHATTRPDADYRFYGPAAIWPWEARWWKPKDRRRDLIRAGALFMAEMERPNQSLPRHRWRGPDGMLLATNERIKAWLGLAIELIVKLDRGERIIAGSAS